MQWSDIPTSPSPRMLRQFAALSFVFFGGLGLWKYFVDGQVVAGTVLGTIAVVLGALGILAPPALKPVFVAWMVAVFPIGWVVSRVVLLLLFFGIVTPVGVVLRLTGRDVLHLRRQRGSTSYWMPKPQPTEVSRYYRQF